MVHMSDNSVILICLVTISVAYLITHMAYFVMHGLPRLARSTFHGLSRLARLTIHGLSRHAHSRRSSNFLLV